MSSSLASAVLRARILCSACFLCLAYALSALPVQAQDHFDAEAFDVAPAQAGSLLTVYGARTLRQGGYSFGLLGSYARDPLTVRGTDNNTLGDLTGSISTLSLLGTVGLFDRVDLGVALPLHRVSRGTKFDTTPPAAVLAARVNQTKIVPGDIRLVPRVALIKREARSGLGLALLAPVWLPTGNNKYYAGESIRVEPRAAVDYAWPRLRLAANVGYLVRKRAKVLGSTVDDMLRWGAGTEVSIVDSVSALLEVNGALNVQSSKFRKNDAPVECLLAVRLHHQGLLAQVGGGTGLVRGITAPQYRLFASIGFQAEPAKVDPDPDHDGIAGALDACPNQPEDRDGFADADGCPDPDDDNDGVPDTADACPNDPEDVDGFEDADGCPDPDNDKDGVPDATDSCPNDPEDADGFQDADGCPDPDNDNDYVPDAEDQCPNEAGVAEEHGCPAPPPSNVKLTEHTIELNQSVYFGLNSAEILGPSLPLMDELADTLKKYPEVKLVVVEGHTDNSGSREHNLTLSKSRAQAVVDALVARGVEAERLRAEGFGPDKPLAPNDNEENRAKNRRVQLRIEKRDPPAPAQ